ncbi:RDD family protein [Janibacter limosus]|uniref:RDD family protein n=1 Tax=Janibacter limosus TaxID=53458 RepID=UPI0035E1CD21|nr:RDD family protein [Janibacter limosus]
MTEAVPSAPRPPSGSDPSRPGSRAWVEQRYGRSAAFADRILPGILDGLLTFAAGFIPLVLGIISIVAGVPDSYDCGAYYDETCSVPGSGSGVLIGPGILLVLLSVVASLAVVAWNRVWRVTGTGQSLGKKVTGLKVIDAESGANPQLGPAALRELVHQFAGIISWIWMLVDDDDRTLADIVGKTHVIRVPKD